MPRYVVVQLSVAASAHAAVTVARLGPRIREVDPERIETLGADFVPFGKGELCDVEIAEGEDDGAQDSRLRL